MPRVLACASCPRRNWWRDARFCVGQITTCVLPRGTARGRAASCTGKPKPRPPAKFCRRISDHCTPQAN
eukprot:7776500-Lingulodinium_polyedra.AAC.1